MHLSSQHVGLIQYKVAGSIDLRKLIAGRPFPLSRRSFDLLLTFVHVTQSIDSSQVPSSDTEAKLNAPHWYTHHGNCVCLKRPAAPTSSPKATNFGFTLIEPS